ncbi:B-cell antigen receptor complex-associated protein alpha chain-like [Chanos chanos]|uniref:B-cell antigen receptor complex-associated protein alpha chain-like n=1 Tax=Chanos chanos TaxID=29144 RepID=A0A6J2W736_CHACN|nr:B-cell antigen receptor complex-associated protein alpha chain-like [Chanos chanos]
MDIQLSVLAVSELCDHKDILPEPDRPSVRLEVSQTATLECCYKGSGNFTVHWVKIVRVKNESTMSEVPDNTGERGKRMTQEVTCHTLTFKEVTLDHAGLYRCYFNNTRGSGSKREVYTHGTYLQVYKPIEKTFLDISDRTKNSIITAEGILLLLCAVIPGLTLICKKKRLNQLERRKDKEQENVYEGLNLEDCNTTYHEIQRSQVQGTYQDVGNTVTGDITLEKP